MRKPVVVLSFYLLFILHNLHALSSNKKHEILFKSENKVELDVDPFIQNIVNQVSGDSILSYLQKFESFGIKDPGSTALVNARDWLANKYQSFGYTDVTFHDFTYHSHTLQNIIVNKPGTVHPDINLIIDGHYDTINGPGTNDNGSGIAVILEIARILANIDCEYTIKFINFSAEEQGLIGSNAYVNNVVVPQNMNILLVFNIDEVGGVAGMVNNTITCERDQGNPPENNAASAAYTDTLSDLTQTYSSLNTVIAHAYGSDYMHFEEAGYVITGYYETNESSHPHSPSDTLGNMDPAYVTEITKGALAAGLYFAKAEKNYLRLIHDPITSAQDTINPYLISLKLQSSSSITVSNCFYQVDDGGFTTLNMELLGTNGDTSLYQTYIPAQNYYSSVDYYFSFENIDTVVTRLPEGAGSYYHFEVLPDTTLPQITHVPINDISYLNDPINFQLTATDENDIFQVHLLVKKNNGLENEIPMNWLGGDNYGFLYSDNFFPGDSIFYRFKAVDNSANKNVSWLPESNYFTFELLNSELFDFEQYEDLFTGDGDWEWGDFDDLELPQPNGVKVWATNLNGNYTLNQVSQLITPQIDLANKTDIKLIISHFYQIEPVNDGGNVKISADSSAFHVIEPEGGYPYSNLYFNEPGYSHNSYYWIEDEFDLTNYSNQQIQLMFDFHSDVFTNKKGWYIDQVRIDFRGEISNHAPQIVYYYPQNLDTLEIGSQQSFSIRAEDIDGDSLIYNIIYRDQIISDSTATFTFNQTGMDTVVARVEDGQGKLDEYKWIFFVKDPASSIINDNNIVYKYHLYPPSPNPFNPITNISYEINKPGNVDISIYNIKGQKLITLVNEFQSTGKYRVVFDAAKYSSGTYFVRMKANRFSANRKLLLIK